MTPELPAGCAIALLGAPGGGKTALADALRNRFSQRGLSTPVLAIDDAASADDELAARRGRLVALLLAPEPTNEPTTDPAIDAGAAARRERIDADLRGALIASATPFAVIHGQDTGERLANAWTAIHARADAADRAAPREGDGDRAWAWGCEKCSDPACEHRLFTDLVARRG